MSTSKQNRARRTAKRRRHKAKTRCTIDFETRSGEDFSALTLDPRRYLMIDKHIGDKDFFDNPQIAAYASSAGLDHYAVIMGGDVLGEPLVPMPREFGVADTVKLIEDVNREITKALSPRMDWKTVRDTRYDPITSRIMPTVNDDPNDG